ncbi:hypothetical protein B0H19DRAFT_1269053 [Mycena capillaripes]|nr:hypothetical protein B0H19DRAFT_1269053 [Mycena capillaripes]
MPRDHQRCSPWKPSRHLAAHRDSRLAVRFSPRSSLPPTRTPTPEYHPLPPPPPITNALGVSFKHLCDVHAVSLTAVATHHHIRAHCFPTCPPCPLTDGLPTSSSPFRAMTSILLLISTRLTPYYPPFHLYLDPGLSLTLLTTMQAVYPLYLQ